MSCFLTHSVVWFAGNLMTSLRLANCSMFVPRRRETLGRPSGQSRRLSNADVNDDRKLWYRPSWNQQEWDFSPYYFLKCIM